ISVTDLDETEPNNQFTVTVTGCPLEPSEPLYTCREGNPVPVQFRLNERLNFEAETSYTCDVNIVDNGSPPLPTSTSISITVTDMPDEPPIFDYTYYYSEVVSPDASSTPLTIGPDPISAQDGDVEIQSPITYTMMDARTDVSGTDYFTMDPNTATVTLTQELDQAILDFETVSFIVTVSNSGLWMVGGIDWEGLTGRD
ncbi:hypothetical protein Pmani_032463, partial [Petrolisthes manimaculis]